ncbi:MAG: right-handed parallel beta-helix repeat-containing protein [Bacteroidaceae bacterium]|nr:right-handed parallel beta-helix repeat-containing protein [Bacteroidaceae bacterium]
MLSKRLPCALIMCLMTLLAMQARTFYVSPSGSDQASGSRRAPWASLPFSVEHALAYMHAHPGEDVQLILRGGEYSIPGGIILEGQNADGRFTIQARRGEQVVLRGDRRLTGWTRVTDTSLLSLWPESCRGRVWQTSLGDIDDLGEPVGELNRPDLYLNGRRQTLSRWPNSGFTRAGRAMGATDLPPTWKGTHGTKEGVLEYLDSRISRWAHEAEPCAFGYWFWDWSEQYHRIKIPSATSRKLMVEGTYHHYGYGDGCRYYGLNLLCELDSAGEYYIDRAHRLIYYYAPQEADLGSNDELTLSCLASPYMLSVRGMDSFTLEGVTVRGCRGGGVEIVGGSGCAIKSCTLSQLGQTAIRIAGGQNHLVQDCLLEELGHDGIKLSGGNRRTLEPAGHVVEGCTVQNFSLFRRTYQPAVVMNGTGFTVRHNLFCGSSSSAMRIDASDCLVEYNQVFDVVKESDDQGGIDMFFDYSRRGVVIRYNHWRNITGSMLCGAAGVRFDDIISGQTVYGNVFEHVGGSQFGGVQIHGGKDNLVENNLFYDCVRAVSFTPWTPEYWQSQFNREEHRRRIFEEADIRSQVYLERFPELREPYDAHLNRNFVRNNLAVRCPELFNKEERGQNETLNNTLFTPQAEESAQPLSYWLQSSVLRKYGLQPIPFGKIGPQGR